MYLKAHWVLPIAGDPLEDGWIEVNGDTIVRTGQGATPRGVEVVGQKGTAEYNRILLPGFVNAHCHLELTLLSGASLKKGSFTGWVREVLRARREMGRADYAQAVREGITKLLLSGVTTVADHTSGYGSIGPLLESPLCGHIFGEVVGRDLSVARELLQASRRLVERVRSSSLAHRVRASTTPHAPHSLHPEVLNEIFAENHTDILSIHLAESRDEDLLYKTGRGPMAEFVAERAGEETIPDNILSLRRSAIRTLAAKHLLTDKVLGIHCNYIDEEDIHLLQKERISIVHCPGSHRFFGHRRFRLEPLLEAGINIAVGTDSVASNEGLNILGELREMQATYPDLKPPAILRMATYGGAVALKWQDQIGSLEAGKKADIIGVPFPGNGESPEEAALKADAVVFSMIDGRGVI